MLQNNRIYMEKVAYYLFARTSWKAKYPNKTVPASYECPEFDSVLRRIQICQVVNRDAWKCMFGSRYRSCGFNACEQILEFVHSAFILLQQLSAKISCDAVVESLSFMDELVQFLCFKNCRLHLQELAHFWSRYFIILKDELSDCDLLSFLFSPLSEEEKLKELTFTTETNLTTPGIPCKSAKRAAFDEKCSERVAVRSMSYADDLKSKVPIETSENKKTEITKLLGVRPHEELLLEFYGITPNAEETMPDREMYSMSSSDSEVSFISSDSNEDLLGFYDHNLHEQTMERKDSLILPVVISRMDQKRQKIRAAYANKIKRATMNFSNKVSETNKSHDS